MLLYYFLIISLPLAEQWFFAYRVAGLPVDKYLGALVMMYAIFYLISRNIVPRFFASAQSRAYLVFYAIACFSWLTARQSDASNDMIIVYTAHLLFMFTTLALLDSTRKVRISLIMGVVALGVVSQYVLREWRYGLMQYGVVYRPGTVGGGPDVFSASALVFLPVAYFFLKIVRSRWEKILLVGCLALGVVAVMVAASRGALLGLAATVLVSVARSRRPVRNFIVLTAVLSVTMVAFPNSPLWRALHPGHGDIESTELHKTVWKAGIRMIKRHPLTGVGLGNFKTVVNDYSDRHVNLIAHNTYIEMGAEMGFPGLLAYIALLFFTFRSLARTRRRAAFIEDPLYYYASTALQAGLVGFCVCQFFVSAQFMKLFWFAVFLSIAFEPLLKARERQFLKEREAAEQSEQAQEKSATENVGYALIQST